MVATEQNDARQCPARQCVQQRSERTLSAQLTHTLHVLRHHRSAHQ